MTGATGYVGGRLVSALLEAGHSVRAASRSLAKLQNRWSSEIELCEADASDLEQMVKACEGCDVVFYLVHSMLPGQKNFQMADRLAAENMRDAAKRAGVKHVIYLGGLGSQSDELSHHLKSRHEVGETLRNGAVPVTELRAAMIIGSGSAAFEILRYLVDRLPVMVTPRWLSTPVQPIAIRNVIHYLVKIIDVPITTSRIFEIGGPQVLAYEDLMAIYAQEAKLGKRFIFRVPILTPRLSSYWIHLVTPVSSAIARPLAEGLKNPVVCNENTITELIPQNLLTPREAIRLALERLLSDNVPTRWSDAGKMPPYEWVYKGDPAWSGGTIFTDKRKIRITENVGTVWKVVSKIGGVTGWYHANFLWRLRGWMDKMVGGVGLRRGRRDEEDIKAGEALDFWRVVDVKPNARLLLAAEMKLPGRALLEFKLHVINDQECELEQTAYFKPRGLMGLLYWYAVLPLHEYVFGGMQKKMARAATDHKGGIK